MEWLRTTPAAPRRPWSLPRKITPATVLDFLVKPPARAEAGELRDEQTIGHYWRMGRPLLEWMGLDVRLKRRERPDMTLPPPNVPPKRVVLKWWQETLGTDGTATKSDRRRVVLMQGLVLLTGMRIGEALKALARYSQGQWLLLHREAAKKRRIRLVYLNSSAMGIAAALRAYTQPTLFELGTERLAGWEKCESAWHSLVADCRAPRLPGAPAEKRHQGLRQVLSNWLHDRDPVAEAAQLGHGGTDVVSRHYLDTIRRLPRHLERFKLPEIEGFTWPAPIEADRGRPYELIEELRRMVRPARGGRKVNSGP